MSQTRGFPPPRPGTARRHADALAEPSVDGPYTTACTILEHIETMIELAEMAGLPPHSCDLLHRAKAEAERVIKDECSRRPPRRDA